MVRVKLEDVCERGTSNLKMSDVTDLSGNNLDLVPDPKNPGHLQAVPVLAVVGGIRWNITPKLFTSANYSLAHVYYENGYTVPDRYKQGQYICGDYIPFSQSGYRFGRSRTPG